jgi:internalin A
VPEKTRQATITQAEANAIGNVERLGGEVVYDFEKFDGANIPADHPRVEQLQIDNNAASPAQVIFVKLDSAHITGDDLEILAQFPTLRGLSISSKHITDDSLRHLSGLSNLEDLWLVGTGIEGRGLHNLTPLKKLKLLNLGGAPITDEGLVILSSVRSLENLIINSNKITDTGLGYLTQLSHLQQLSIDGTKITGEGLRNLARFPALTGVELTSEQFAAAGIDYIIAARQLHTIWIYQGTLTAEQEEKLKNARPDLQIVIIQVQT